MEPRLFSHGYRYVAGLVDADEGPSMEPRLFSHGYFGPSVSTSPADAPSMEPRLFSHGYQGSRHLPGKPAHPSMEPRLFSHGYPGSFRRRHSSRRHLQWSHGFSAMDTSHAVMRACGSSSFNGATAFQPWIHWDNFAFLGDFDRLQWSHGFSAMDTMTVSM